MNHKAMHFAVYRLFGSVARRPAAHNRLYPFSRNGAATFWPNYHETPSGRRSGIDMA